MQATVYANLTTRRLTTTLGGSAIPFPAFVQGDKVRIGLRFAESLEGSPIEVQKIVTHIRASIGFVDARPTSGSFVLNVDGQNTASIPHDATAGAVQTALAAIGLDGAVVGKQDGSWIISTGLQGIELSGYSAGGLLSELRPVSFVRVRSIQVAGQYRHEVRLVQITEFCQFDPTGPAGWSNDDPDATGGQCSTTASAQGGKSCILCRSEWPASRPICVCGAAANAVCGKLSSRLDGLAASRLASALALSTQSSAPANAAASSSVASASAEKLDPCLSYTK
jgi:hypothetical protein